MNDQPHRLRRLQTVWTSRGRPLFFVTTCTRDRRPLLANASIHEAFISFCANSPEKASVWVGRYVLMPDHIHLFASTEGSNSLSRWMGALKGFLAAKLREQGETGPFWQEGFFDHLMRAGESFSGKWAYVEQNPVRAGLVLSPDAWPYSGEICPLSWD